MNEGPIESGSDKPPPQKEAGDKEAQKEAKKDVDKSKKEAAADKKSEHKGSADSVQGQNGTKPGDKSKEDKGKDLKDNKNSESQNAIDALPKRPDVTLRGEKSGKNKLNGDGPQGTGITPGDNDNRKNQSKGDQSRPGGDQSRPGGDQSRPGGDQTRPGGDQTQIGTAQAQQKGVEAKDEASGLDKKTNNTDSSYRTISQDGRYEVVKDLDYKPVYRDGKFENPNTENKKEENKGGETDKSLERKSILNQAKEDSSSRTKDQETKVENKTDKDVEIKTKDSQSDTKDALSEFEIIERNRVADIYDKRDIDPAINDRWTSDLATGVGFKHNEHDVSLDQSQELEPGIERIANALEANPRAFVLIEGYTDRTGDQEYNNDLAGRRADSVKNVLVDKFGIDEERIQTRASGPVVQFAEANEVSNAEHRVAIIDIRFEKQ